MKGKRWGIYKMHTWEFCPSWQVVSHFPPTFLLNWLQLGQAVPCSAAQVSQDLFSGDRDSGIVWQAWSDGHIVLQLSLPRSPVSAGTETTHTHTHTVRAGKFSPGATRVSRLRPEPTSERGPAGGAPCWAGDRHPAQAVLAEHPCTTACKTFHFSLLTPSAPLRLWFVACIPTEKHLQQESQGREVFH